MVRFIIVLLAVLTLGLPGCSRSEEKPRKAKQTTAGAGYIQTTIETRNAMQERLYETKANQAIQRFQIEHGRSPEDLDELIDYGSLGSLPPGVEYDYDPVRGRVTVR